MKASTLKRLLKCPLSYHLTCNTNGFSGQLSKSCASSFTGAPSHSNGPDDTLSCSDIGTAKHYLAGRLISHHLDQIYISDAATAKAAIPLTDDVSLAVDIVFNLLPDGHVVANVERYISWLGVSLCPDLWFIYNGHLHVIDYKFGSSRKIAVYPNSQLLLYVCAICDIVAPEVITCHIIAPNTDEPHSFHTNTYENLLPYKKQCERLFMKVMSGYSMACPSKDACNGCQFVSSCQFSSLRNCENSLKVKVKRKGWMPNFAAKLFDKTA